MLMEMHQPQRNILGLLYTAEGKGRLTELWRGISVTGKFQTVVIWEGEATVDSSCTYCQHPYQGKALPFLLE